MKIPIMKFTCPCCGYFGLDLAPYAKMVSPSVEKSTKPPYSRYFGDPSYEVCPCCGFEFGNDDEPGTGSPVSFDEYLREWIKDGKVWFDESKRPDNWSFEEQLKSII